MSERKAAVVQALHRIPGGLCSVSYGEIADAVLAALALDREIIAKVCAQHRETGFQGEVLACDYIEADAIIAALRAA